MTKYNCAMCGEEEELTTPKKEMEAELKENFEGHYVEDCEIVCDNCYNKPDVTRAMAYNRNIQL